MGRVLYLTAHFPSPNAKYAGHKTAFMFLKEYAENSDNVDMIVICNSDEDDFAAINTLNNVRVLKYIPLSPLKKLKNIILSRKIFPLKVTSRYSTAIVDWLALNISQYDTIHFEFVHIALYLDYIDFEYLKGKKIIVSSPDVLIQPSLRQATNFFMAYDSIKTFEFEQRIYMKASKIIVQNSKDKMLINALYGVKENKIEVRMPIISSFVYNVKKLRTSNISENALLFWGAMNRKENIDAIINFVKLYNDLLIEKNYTLYIVGANPSEAVINLQNEHIIVTGFIDDPTEYFLKAKYGIVPLLSGGGIKVKTLEMLEAGLPVVSTYVGAEGIEHKDLHVCDIKNFFDVL